MDQQLVSLIVGVTGPIVTMVGWVVPNKFTLQRDEPARKDSRQKDLDARIASDLRADKIKRLEGSGANRRRRRVKLGF